MCAFEVILCLFVNGNKTYLPGCSFSTLCQPKPMTGRNTADTKYLFSVTCASQQDAQGLLEESRSLEKKVHLASEAQKAAKDVEQDYAEVSQ